MLTLSEIGRSRYLLFRGLCDAGFPAGNAALAVDILLGPEPAEDGPDWDVEPEPEDRSWVAAHPALPPISGGAPDDGPDWDEYAAWSAWQDALEAAHPRYGEEDARAAGLAI